VCVVGLRLLLTCWPGLEGRKEGRKRRWRVLNDVRFGWVGEKGPPFFYFILDVTNFFFRLDTILSRPSLCELLSLPSPPASLCGNTSKSRTHQMLILDWKETAISTDFCSLQKI
jgi:hypothetical protein